MGGVKPPLENLKKLYSHKNFLEQTLIFFSSEIECLDWKLSSIQFGQKLKNA
jgi:hypothetical protein